MNCNDFARKILNYGCDIAGYILGFPVHYHTPTDDQLHLALNRLNELKREEYAKTIVNYGKQLFSADIPFSVNKPIFSNTDDVIFENINNYSPFDIVSYRDGDYIYRFTRPEFDNLLKSKKNHWTNDWLPKAVLATILSRVSTAKELKLPESRPLIELLRRVEEDQLFTFPDDVDIVNPEPTGPSFSFIGLDRSNIIIDSTAQFSSFLDLITNDATFLSVFGNPSRNQHLAQSNSSNSSTIRNATDNDDNIMTHVD